MTSLANALRKLGVIPEEKYSEIIYQERQDYQRENAESIRYATKKSRPTVNLERLRSADTVAEFKNIAKKILQQHPNDPELMQEIIDATHDFRNSGNTGGKKLVWIIFKVRDNLKIVAASKRKHYLNRALRKNNPKLEVPLEWRK